MIKLTLTDNIGTSARCSLLPVSWSTARRDREAADDLRLIGLLYLPVWLTAPLTAESAYNDLRLCQNILRFREVDEVVAEAALNKMYRITSHLRPETLLICLASEVVNADHRADIASTLLTRPDD